MSSAIRVAEGSWYLWNVHEKHQPWVLLCTLQDSRGELSREERLIVPFLACGDLSGYDADQSYDLPDEHYVSLDPVQPPTAPAYKNALKAKRLNQHPREQT